MKVVEIQCFEIKSYVSRSLLILCTLLKAGDTSLINDIQQKVYIFFFKFWTLQLSIQPKINIKMFALKDTKNIIFHIFESKYSWMDLWVCIYQSAHPLIHFFCATMSNWLRWIILFWLKNIIYIFIYSPSMNIVWGC